MTNGFFKNSQKNIKGISIIESLVVLVIVGIGFIAINQMIAFSVSSMDRSMEKTKVNFLPKTYRQEKDHSSALSTAATGAS